ncbi:cAMP-dependent protein kinase catalytic subunit PRKX-like [Actinia tenebrosa]|nr:cAMP-dependent protein kinase catalytic subunit PRKX-like [Actinia tenebrosa]
MLVGYPPFFDDNPFGIYEKILSGKVEWPKHMENTAARDLIKRLLVHDRTRRLGSMKNGAEDVKGHKWFKVIDWNLVYQRKLKPPIVPKIAHSGDTRNFDEYPEEDWKSAPPLHSKQLEPFKDF